MEQGKESSSPHHPRRVFGNTQAKTSAKSYSKMGTSRTFAFIEALEERLELLFIQNGTFRVSLPQGHPCLLQP